MIRFPLIIKILFQVMVFLKTCYIKIWNAWLKLGVLQV